MQKSNEVVDSDELQAKDESNRRWVWAWKQAVKKVDSGTMSKSVLLLGILLLSLGLSLAYWSFLDLVWIPSCTSNGGRWGPREYWRGPSVTCVFETGLEVEGNFSIIACCGAISEMGQLSFGVGCGFCEIWGFVGSGAFGLGSKTVRNLVINSSTSIRTMRVAFGLRMNSLVAWKVSRLRNLIFW